MGNDVIFKGVNFEPGYRTTPDSLLKNPNRLFFNGKPEATVDILGDHLTTPEQLFSQQEKNKTEKGHLVSIDAFYKAKNGLSIKGEISHSARKSNYSSFIPSQLILNNPKYLSSKEKTVLFSQQYDCSYSKTLRHHSFNTFFRFRNYNDKVDWKIDSTLNVDQQNIQVEDDVYLRGSMALYDSQSSVRRSIHSYILSFNYNFKDKYFISILGNFDNLAEGKEVKRHDLFKSFAVKWDLREESLLNFPVWLTRLNMYANYGEAGNYPLNGLSNDIYSTESIYSANDQAVRASHISNLANHQLKHEKVEEINLGMEIGFFSNRIVLSGDYYRKNNSNLLLLKTIPTYYGGGLYYQNVGELKSDGVELKLEYTLVNKHRFNWVSSIGFSSYNQIVTKLSDNEEVQFNNSSVLIPDFILKENE